MYSFNEVQSLDIQDLKCSHRGHKFDGQSRIWSPSQQHALGGRFKCHILKRRQRLHALLSNFGHRPYDFQRKMVGSFEYCNLTNFKSRTVNVRSLSKTHAAATCQLKCACRRCIFVGGPSHTINADGRRNLEA